MITCNSHFKVTSEFDSVCIFVARWVSLRQKCLRGHDLLILPRNVLYCAVFSQMYCFHFPCALLFPKTFC